MRALFVGHTAAPSGAELATARLVAALRESHPVEASVILTEDGPMIAKMRAQGIPTTVLPNAFDSRSMTIQGSGWLRRLAGGAALLRVGWSLGAAARDHRADVLIAGSTKALVMSAVAAARARIPLLWQVHDRISAEYFGRTLSLMIRALGWIVADGYIANSRSTADTVARWRRRSVIAYPGADFSRTTGTRREPQRAPEEATVAVVGRLTPWKGQDVVLRALARTALRPRRVYLVGGTFFGEESFRNELEDLARELQLPVEFTGHVDDPTEILLGSDILVHSSVIAEPFGQVIVEGLQAGCAVIATRPGGPAEIVEPDVSGLLVDAGDTADLTVALDQLIADAQLRTRLAQAGRLRAQRFDVAESARVVAKFLADIVTSRGGHTRTATEMPRA
ncbi:glycosyltransferase family 4 protein [Mycobacterium sp. TNTM28]|uniref:Glycosyltransferase family 4 protein n=1 Tax=[Mycobacterium] fortunisiensis TaxID=2600579 RepID=A0ABS6KGM1_9MYCO|nr:glycosyltransferase family 4 protein [[Mycobacterium] fortunisiensis]